MRGKKIEFWPARSEPLMNSDKTKQPGHYTLFREMYKVFSFQASSNNTTLLFISDSIF